MNRTTPFPLFRQIGLKQFQAKCENLNFFLLTQLPTILQRGKLEIRFLRSNLRPISFFFLRGQLAANNYLLMLLTRYYARVFPPKYTTPHVECVKDINTSNFAQFPFTPSVRETINPKLKIFFFLICNDSLLSVGREGFSYKFLHRRNLESFCINWW